MRSREAPMLDKACNGVVRFVQAKSNSEKARLINSLPATARTGLEEDLKQIGEAYRFDLSQETAYYFQRQNAGLSMWRWQCLGSYDEIGELLARVASLDEPITEALANNLFVLATHRSVASPEPSREDRERNYHFG